MNHISINHFELQENHDEVEPSSFVVIDDRELEEPQDSLIPNEDTEIQSAEEARFDQKCQT